MAQLRKSSVSPMKMQTLRIKRGESVRLVDAEASSAQKSDERSQERRMQIFSTVCGKFTALVAVVGKHVIMPLAAGLHFGAIEPSVQLRAGKQRHLIRVVFFIHCGDI